MFNKEIQEACLSILKSEMHPALGCTEPIAVAYASAKARQILGMEPDHIRVTCSGNIIKNTQSVIVPCSGGRKGIETAAILGALAGDAALGLSVLEPVTPACFEALDRMLSRKLCECCLAAGKEGLYIEVRLYAANESAAVELCDRHDCITKIEKNGVILEQRTEDKTACDGLEKCYDLLSVRNIMDFSENVSLYEISDLARQQLELNQKISREGLTADYGARVGRTLQKESGDFRSCLKAAAAAGSDARMNGCPLPVVINSGSGNQGLTISMPVAEYAQRNQISQDRMYRAIVMANLLGVHQKRTIGRLSAFCGAVSAAAASMAAVTWLAGGTYEAVCGTITNTIATIGGMVCDGAKSSCAAKISAALDAAYTAHLLSMDGYVFQPGEGLVGENVEQTILRVGRMAKVGMHKTDLEILSIMLGK